MPVPVELPDEVFSRLQKHAVPLIDTPLTVIVRALDALEAGDEEPAGLSSTDTARAFNPAAAPSLAHTKPLKACVDGEVLSKAETYWNPILFAVINAAAKRGTSADDLLELLTINSVKGEKHVHGYRYLPTAGISVQGQDADSAWKQAHRVASSVGVPVEVTFVWQDNQKAAMPNATGSFTIAD